MKRALVLAATAAFAFAPAAVAKVWFTSVGGETFVVGARVATKIVGCPVPCPVAGTKVALGRPTGTTNRAVPLTRPVGIVDRQGWLRFRIPTVRRGTYRLVARVRGGEWFVASAPLRLEPVP